MSEDMATRTVLITGCSDGGLGAALALALHAAGYRVVASARNPDRLQEVKRNGIQTVLMDITSVESTQQGVRQVQTLLADGQLDMLINSIGAVYMAPVTDTDLDATRHIFEVNTISFIALVQAFLPLLRNSGRGTIINTTSGSSTIGLPLMAVYNASKAAATTLTQNLRLELAPFGIRVVELRTGTVKTGLLSKGSFSLPENSIYAPARTEIDGFLRGDDLKKIGSPRDEWAQQVVRAIARGDGPVLYGGAMTFLIRYLAHLLPYWLFDRINRKMTYLDVLEVKLKEQQQQQTKVKSA